MFKAAKSMVWLRMENNFSVVGKQSTKGKMVRIDPGEGGKNCLSWRLS